MRYVKHDGYAERSDRATAPADTTPSPWATTSRASTTLAASPALSRAAALSTAAAHAIGLRTGVTSSVRAADARIVDVDRSSRSSAPSAADVMKVRPRALVTAKAGILSSRPGKPDHGPRGSRSGRYAKPPTATRPVAGA